MAILAGWLFQSEWRLSAQSLFITEFMAANASGERDEDGDFSDWIEVFNATPQAVSLKGWCLTDDSLSPGKWRFPDVTIPAQGYVVVYASGKSRVDPKKPLHTNFSLDRDGEYLALVGPDGSTIASEFAPVFPRQLSDISYGRSTSTPSERLVPFDAVGRLLVPDNNQLGLDWTRPEYEDAAWSLARQAAGYFRIPAGPGAPPEGGPALSDVTQPSDLIVATSSNSPGNEGVVNAIDNNPATKYLNFDKLNEGLTVTPSAGLTAVTGLRFTSANDAPDRDPTSFLLLGSNDGRDFTEIARGPIPSFAGRFASVQVAFSNTLACLHYRLLFPTVRNAAAAVAMQIAEVEWLGRPGPFPPTFSELIATNLEGSLYGRRSSVFLRFPVVWKELSPLERLVLRVRYDDGFVAWLNGVEVARANAPASPAFDSVALTNRSIAEAVYEEQFHLSSHAARLKVGTNLLAIQGLNDGKSSPDFLIQAQLDHTRVRLGDLGYFQVPTPGGENGPSSVDLVTEVAFSRPRGFYTNPFELILSCPTEGAVIRYTTNGSLPSLSHGTVYTNPLPVSRTTVLRAAAFREGWLPSRAGTHTYLFLSDVLAQTETSALAAGFPSAWNGQAPDYGLDPRIIGPNGTDQYGGKYTQIIQSDLRAIPTLSLVMEGEDMFGSQGIYSNPLGHGEAWERPVSLELIEPPGRDDFQANAGLRIQGGAFRRFDLTMKKSFRVIFREKYGDAELKYPFFGPEAANHFNNFVLRANSNDAWPYAGARALYVRDAFAMETARAMGMTVSHTTFVHLYINGLYWGIYNPVERPDAAFASTYLGGARDSWDAINQDSVPDGNSQAWSRLLSALKQDMTRNEHYQRLQGNNPDGSRNPSFENLLDVHNMIDYLILNFYVGNTDWPGRNWWVGRNREGQDGFGFFPWDTETALGFTALETDVTGVSGAVAQPYAALRNNVEFRMAFADHVFRHFSPGGPLYVNPASPSFQPAHPENNRPAARFLALAEIVDRAIVGESARWGDQLNRGPFTRDEHWRKERDRLLADYFPRRSALVLDQFRRAKLYPRTEPPVMNQRGGQAPPGFQLTLTAPAGVIYYTTNGLDPRAPVTGLPDRATKYVQPLVLRDLTTIKTRVLNGQEWSALQEATFVVGSPSLVFSELHYHPADASSAEQTAGFTDADDFEFIELLNNGVGTYDLTGLRFVRGVQFDFAGSSISKLPSRACVLIVKNRAAFERRYGTGLPVAGEFSGQLNNSGERLQLLNRQGESILDLTYGTRDPWPKAADGDGPALEAASLSGDQDAASRWRASLVSGGSPGKPNPAPALRIAKASLRGGQLYIQLSGFSGAGFTVHLSDSLAPASWQEVQHFRGDAAAPLIEIFLDLPPHPATRFFRVSIP